MSVFIGRWIKKLILPFGGTPSCTADQINTWKNMEKIMLAETCQTEKEKQFMALLTESTILKLKYTKRTKHSFPYTPGKVGQEEMGG